jgi:2-polyprenyl-6-methoxyphenol hydroxylase-like FAD-dependent oxidoreductase
MVGHEATSMSIKKRVLIVGGGVGGMATAIRLAETGFAVDLIDLDPEWRVYGAGITIIGPTLRAYRDLGLLEEIKAEGAVTNATSIFRADGPHLTDMAEPPLENGLPATGGILRPSLHRIMQRRVKALDIPVRLGITVEQMVEGHDTVTVTFSDASTGTYDLVVGADSVNSRVRSLLFPHMAPPVLTGQGCWRTTAARPPGLERVELYIAPFLNCGITACSKDQVYLWFLAPHTAETGHIPDEELHDRLRAHLAPFGGNAAWIRDHLTTDAWVNYRPLAAALQPKPWHTGRVVLLGDAVHATTPHLAAGAGLAVESALVLAEELAKSPSDLTAALHQYQERRYERCRDVIETSVKVGQLQLSGASPMEIGAVRGACVHRLAAPI